MNTHVRRVILPALAGCLTAGILAFPPVVTAAPITQPALISTVDGVRLNILTGFAPQSRLGSSIPGALGQAVGATSFNPYQHLAIVAIPFETKNRYEGIVAHRGKSDEHRRYLADLHEKMGAKRRPESPSISMFGAPVQGITTTEHPPGRGPDVLRTTVEWVAEAGDRVWIVRAQADGDGSAADRAAFLDRVRGTTITSDNPNVLTTVGTMIRSRALTSGAGGLGSFGATGMPAPTFGMPSWWHGGICDPANNPGSVEIGRWGDLIACGPNNDIESRTDPAAGWYGQLEWECVELSKRYLNQRYHLRSTNAYGYNLVESYFDPQYGIDMAGTPLIRVYPGAGRVPVPGDVLSFGAGAPGHTGVVISAVMFLPGTGVITMINENADNGAPGSAFIEIPIIDGAPQPLGQLEITDWLHDVSLDTP